MGIQFIRENWIWHVKSSTIILTSKITLCDRCGRALNTHYAYILDCLKNFIPKNLRKLCCSCKACEAFELTECPRCKGETRVCYGDPAEPQSPKRLVVYCVLCDKITYKSLKELERKLKAYNKKICENLW